MSKTLLIILAAACLVSCKTTTYFIVRHAERDNSTMSSDVPLSDAGKQRAEALRDELKNKKIGTIYSTNYIRTKSTAQPLADAIGLTVQVYDPKDSTFVSRMINTGNKDKEGNMLIIGHSNTVDDIVNQLLGQKMIPGDLPDSQYGDLFVVKQRGRKFTYEKKRYGP
jgi:2,3-bisphosphoglycerate-dependent phosphoglycerate mutase